MPRAMLQLYALRQAAFNQAYLNAVCAQIC
jgi:hypothetical protein